MSDHLENHNEDSLIPANLNPYYVLMTLYGEQDGAHIDWELHDKNRAVWNAWSCQNMTEADREALAESSISLKDFVQELAAWENIKADVEKRFKTVWKERNGELECPELPDVSKKIDLMNVKFPVSLIMNNTVFSIEVWFNRSKFLGNVYFRQAKFTDDTWFTQVRFAGEANFSEISFSSIAWFEQAMFTEDVSFNRTRFSGETGFDDAIFTNEVLFNEAIFTNQLWFNQTTFDAVAYFTDVKFGVREGHQTVCFVDCQFSKFINFRNTQFQANYPDFSGTILHEKSIFTVKDECWPKTTSQDSEEARASCATIRHFLDKQGFPEDAHFFFRREMSFAGKTGSFGQRLPYLLYGWFSNYGYSIARPLSWLLGLIIIGWIVVGLWKYETLAAGEVWALQNIFEALSISVSATLPFMGLMRSLHPDFYSSAPLWLDSLSTIQSFLGIILLFLIGLALRTRFRMR